MSRGKPRHAAAQTTEEAAEHIRLRQLTRELHEAAQEAKEAARELRDARAETAGMIDELIYQHVHEWDQRTTEYVREFGEKIKKVTDESTAYEAKLLGCADQEELLTYIVDHLRESMQPVLTRQVSREVEKNLPAYIRQGLKQLGHDPANADIVVTTKDMMDHPAMKGRIVLDMT